MTTWVSAGIWICVHPGPRPIRWGLIFSLVAENFSRFQGPAPKCSLLHQHYPSPPVLFSAVSEHIINTESSARTERDIHKSRELGALLQLVRDASSVRKEQFSQPNGKRSERHIHQSRLASGTCLPQIVKETRHARLSAVGIGQMCEMCVGLDLPAGDQCIDNHMHCPCNPTNARQSHQLGVSVIWACHCNIGPKIAALSTIGAVDRGMMRGLKSKLLRLHWYPFPNFLQFYRCIAHSRSSEP